MWYEKPFALTWEDWEVFDKETSKKHPIQWFFRETLMLFFARLKYLCLERPYWYLKAFFFGRHNRVICKHLPITWVDRDTLMFHCCFQILVDFIEKENPLTFKMNDAEIMEVYGEFTPALGTEKVKTWHKIRELYNWYKNREYDDPVMYNVDKDGFDKIDTKLRELIDVRSNLWT